MINFHSDQADIICEVFRSCKLLNFSDDLLAKFISAKAGSLTHRSQQPGLIVILRIGSFDLE